MWDWLGHFEPQGWAAVALGTILLLQNVGRFMLGSNAAASELQGQYLDAMGKRIEGLERKQDTLGAALAACHQNHAECQLEVADLRTKVEKLEARIAQRT